MIVFGVLVFVAFIWTLFELSRRFLVFLRNLFR